MIHQSDTPPYRFVCSHCRRGQTAGASWHSDGHGKLFCERCVAKALELLSFDNVKRVTYRSYLQSRLMDASDSDVASE